MCLSVLVLKYVNNDSITLTHNIKVVVLDHGHMKPNHVV